MRTYHFVSAMSVAAGLCLSGCKFELPSSTAAPSQGNGSSANAPANRVVVDMAVSSEKIALLNELAATFNDDKKLSTFTGPQGKTQRAFIRVQKKASGAAAQLLVDGWDENTEGPQPVIWSPAASSWGAIVNQRLTDAGKSTIIPNKATPFMLTPLVLAMPEPMADALGYPKTPVGYADLLALAKDPTGWASKGHPEWGTFKLGKTNPNFSTSGLSATIAQYYAATGKSAGLTSEDLDREDVKQFSSSIESSVVHYGDITMTFLNNWFQADARGTSLGYASAVAVEEKSLIDYNLGNPDGILDPGETPRKPRVPLVAVYPKEGTLFSDNPFMILDASWVDDAEKAAATAFEAFVQLPTNQQKVLSFGFRPGNPAVAVGAPIIAANGVDPSQPKNALGVPAPKVLVKLLDLWAEQRKGARVLFVIDVSGSMGERAGDGIETKLDLAKRAAISALKDFKADDEVGVRIFSTNITADGADFLDLVPIGPIAANREAIRLAIDGLMPTNATPLYEIAQKSLDDMKASIDNTRINAVVLLTDGQNEDAVPSDDQQQLDQLLRAGRSGAEGRLQAEVRIFPIAYGHDADLATLKRIAEATTGIAYDATDPNSIEKVFVNVVSNF
jgi:Ca-activated chloride channel homolog